jgi:hypothetical protein
MLAPGRKWRHSIATHAKKTRARTVVLASAVPEKAMRKSCSCFVSKYRFCDTVISKIGRPLRGWTGVGARLSPTYNWLILARNSLFDPALASRSIRSSIASTGDSGFSTLRSTQMRCKSSFGISSSSLRVPER